MEIMDILGRTVKIGKTSVTVKNTETGKTAGVVRNLRKFFDLPANKQFELSTRVRQSGLWGLDLGRSYNDPAVSQLLFDLDGKGYFLYSEKSERQKAAAEKAAEYFTIIPCKVLL